MYEIEKYINDTLQKAKTILRSEYHLESFKLSDFQAINFFLIDRSLNENINIFIQSFDKELPSLSQFPTVIAVSISLFFKNYCDNITEYKCGDILQKDGLRYEYIKRNDNGTHYLKGHNGYLPEVTDKNLKKYLITNADLTKRKVKTKFNEYKNLFKLIFNVDDVPSKFKYNSAIVLEKKDFDEEIKNQTYTEINILKAIPIRWISKNGTESWNHIPIEPMIYCVPDLDTFQEFIIEKNIKIETLVIIGKNKYKSDTLSSVKRLLREKIVPNCIILGSEPISDNNNLFLKWRWTFKEYSVLSKNKLSEITPIPIENTEFEKCIWDFISFIENLESEYSINLNRIKLLRKYLYPLVLSKEEHSRNITQNEYIYHLLKKITTDLVIENLYNQNIDPSEELINAEKHFQKIFSAFNNDKYKKLIELKNYQILIVPEILLSNWQHEYLTSAKLYSFKSFIKNEKEYSTRKNVILLSLWGNGLHPSELIETLINTSHNYSILSYSEESNIISNLKNRNYNDTINEYTSDDRKLISGIKFNIKPKEVKVSDIIEDLHHKSIQDKKDYFYDYNESVDMEISFEESQEKIICDASRKVLLNSNGTWIKSEVSNLMIGDKVRVYNNLSKEMLFDIAAQEDSKGRFNEVDRDSQIWKKSLYNYYGEKKKENSLYTEEDLLQELSRNGLTITNYLTIKKWLNLDDKERFPNSTRNLIAIKETLNDEILNQNFITIKQSKKFYRGIMISLGRDLSDDVMDYIISNGKLIGKVLSKFTKVEIESFIQNAAPIRVIKNIKITEEDESN